MSLFLLQGLLLLLLYVAPLILDSDSIAEDTVYLTLEM